MKALTFEEQIEAIVERKAAELIAPLREEIDNQRRLILDLDEWKSTEWIQLKTGISDVRTLKKHFKHQQKGKGPIKWSKAQVLQWLADNELKKAS